MRVAIVKTYLVCSKNLSSNTYEYNLRKDGLMEIIIDCGDKELAKAIADKLSEDTGVARDKFKESTHDEELPSTTED